MRLELDHIFVATSEPDVLESALADCDIAFTRRQVHEGQGTANACAVFDNAFLEILWATDRKDLLSEAVAPLGLDERTRWRETGACPFGVCFRATTRPDRWPFPSWQYVPSYAPAGIPIATPPGALADPLVFITVRPPDAGAKRGPDAASHAGARRVLTRVALHRPPSQPLSPAVSWFVEEGLLNIHDAAEHRLELEWDAGRQGRSHRSATQPSMVLLW